MSRKREGEVSDARRSKILYVGRGLSLTTEGPRERDLEIGGKDSFFVRNMREKNHKRERRRYFGNSYAQGTTKRKTWDVKKTLPEGWGTNGRSIRLGRAVPDIAFSRTSVV